MKLKRKTNTTTDVTTEQSPAEMDVNMDLQLSEDVDFYEGEIEDYSLEEPDLCEWSDEDYVESDDIYDGYEKEDIRFIDEDETYDDVEDSYAPLDELNKELDEAIAQDDLHDNFQMDESVESETSRNEKEEEVIMKENNTTLAARLRAINKENNTCIERVETALMNKAALENATSMEMNITNEHLQFVCSHLTEQGLNLEKLSETKQETRVRVTWA